MTNDGQQRPRSADMHSGPGFRVRYEFERPDPALIEGYRDFETPDVSDLLNRLYTMRPTIRPITPPHLRLIGPACTVKVFPGDNLMVHKSLDVARPGDVVVVDSSGTEGTAVLGDLVSTKARHRGIAGFVVDGLIRDQPRILALEDFPVFATGVTPLGPLHRGPGELNYPVSAGGIVVHPGDLVMADQNGVVVIPIESVEDTLVRLREMAASQASYLAAVVRGEFSNVWADEILEGHGIKPPVPDQIGDHAE